MNTFRLVGFAAGLIAGGLSPAMSISPAAAQTKIPGLSAEPPDRVAIYTVKGRGVSVPFIVFQERARRAVEAHMNAEIVPMDEALSRGGPGLPKRLFG
ncbi:MAG: hypothetical protein AAF449_07515, partial [Myxococcota bacterium]